VSSDVTPAAVAPAGPEPAADPPAAPAAATRKYSNWAGNETLEDYSLRYAPKSFRRWSEYTVATTALGGIAYLADFAIGGSIAITHGFANAVAAVIAAAVVIFLTGIPIAYYSAKYSIDMDLLTRAAGFGYLGSTITSIVYASFTFIFFALEGSIMAQAFKSGFGLPLWAGYLVASLIVLPFVVYGMTALSKLQVWTQPLWLILMVAPFVYLVVSHPESVNAFFAYGGTSPDGKPLDGSFNMGNILLAAGVCLSLIAQIAEQNDYLRFMPPKTPENKRSWWTWMFLAGPGWVIFGAIKQIVGLFLAVYLIGAAADNFGIANQPVHQFLEIYRNFLPPWLAMTLAVVLVVISQIKINVTNAYSGSLAWTNSFTRVTKTYPGRLWFLGFNLLIALILMEANMFSFLNTILGFYANCGMAWVVVVASDIVFNKFLLKLSPMKPEFRRGMLYNFNPVGFGSMLIAAGVSVLAFFGGLGSVLTPYSPLVAIGLALVLPPILAIATKGKYYLRRTDDGIDLPMYDEYGNPSDAHLRCHVCHHEYERPDMMKSTLADSYICSLCLSTDKKGEYVLPAQT
jgi:purine-cytosine permease-like protein